MTVRLNEVGLRTFFNGPQMERILRPRAEVVVQQADMNASFSGPETLGIESGDLSSGIRYDIQPGVDSLEAVIGTNARDENTGFFYPYWWDRYGGKPWLTNALLQFFPDAQRNT